MSSGSGSSLVMSFCVAVKTSRSLVRVESTALMDLSLPTKRGTIMKGNITTSRTGSSGRASGISSCSSSFLSSAMNTSSLFSAPDLRPGQRGIFTGKPPFVSSGRLYGYLLSVVALVLHPGHHDGKYAARVVRLYLRGVDRVGQLDCPEKPPE